MNPIPVDVVLNQKLNTFFRNLEAGWIAVHLQIPFMDPENFLWSHPMEETIVVVTQEFSSVYTQPPASFVSNLSTKVVEA